jgi:hypothetical protein
MQRTSNSNALALFGRALACALLGLAPACSSGGSGSSGVQNAVLTVVQDLTLDPDGLVTVVSFQGAIAATLDESNFESDGTQVAQSVVVAGDEATVTWDERVTPSHEVRVVGLSGTPAVFVAVDTTDDAPPTYAVTDAQQVGGGLGNDTLEIEFSGAHVVPETAEDLANWTLEVQGQELDLTGSVFSFDALTQVLSVDLGAGANLHADFELSASGVLSVADVAVDTIAVAGVAMGDNVAPTLVSAEQNLAEDEFGTVVDFTFSEPMDPVFSVSLGSFGAGFPVFTTSVEQVADDVLRVSFTAPIVPGVANIALSNLVDSHGNAFTNGNTAIAAGSLVANDFDGDPELITVENAGGDHLVASFEQALITTSAENHLNWSLEAPLGSPVDLSTLTLDYDFNAKTLTIELPDDYKNGDTFEFAAAGAGALEVDGESFGGSFQGAIAGDALAPSAVELVQNRGFDPTGLTYDVEFSEQLDEVEAETTANYAFSNGANVTSATLMPSGLTVRLVLDALAVPGEHTADLSAVEDLAGNAAAAQLAVALASDDLDAPLGTGVLASAVEGQENDTLSVVFDDDMLESEVEDALNWQLESPIGQSIDLSATSIVYEPVSRTATLTFDDGNDVNLQVLESFELALVDMRDIGGNEVDATPLTGTVGGESTLPQLIAAYVDAVDPGLLHVRFSEPCQVLDDLFDAVGNPAGTRYAIYDAVPALVGLPNAVLVDADRMGAALSYGVALQAGVHTLALRGVLDLAGNPLFSLEGQAIAAEDGNDPLLAVGLSAAITVTGEENDELSIAFDRPMSGWGMLTPGNFGLTLGLDEVDLSGASFEFDGNAELSVRFEQGAAPSLETGAVYTLEAFNLLSAEGNEIAGISSDAVIPAGDAVGPALVAGRVTLDPLDPNFSVLVELDEAIDAAQAEDESLIDILGVVATNSTRLGQRTLRATFAGGLSLGQTVNVTYDDLAGNAGVASQAIAAADAVAPVLQSLDAIIRPNLGGDVIEIAFSEPVGSASALQAANYSVTNGASIDLSGASLRYASSTNTVRILLPAGTELDANEDVLVAVSNVFDHAGNALPGGASLQVAPTGDALAPSFAAAFINLRADVGGQVVDLLFSEDVDSSVAELAASYTASGGQTVLSAQLLGGRMVRLELASPFVLGQTIETTGMPDLAGNASGAIDVTPL